MAGGEFRLGTDSIYMALTCHIRCLTAIYISHITWLRFPSQFPGTPSNSTPYRFSKKEVRAKLLYGSCRSAIMPILIAVKRRAPVTRFMPKLLFVVTEDWFFVS